tara:strand:- start:4794 stop:5792 length:999 start_codon:yes stop_codon:yes gene_type:complete
MAGLRKMQKTEEEGGVTPALPSLPEEATIAPMGTVVAEKSDSIWGEIETAADTVNDNYILCGLVGMEGCTKTGVVLDSLTDEEVQNGDSILVLDFDGGAASCRSSYHRDKSRNIRCLDPWVMQTEDRTAYNYPATHERVMKIGFEAIAWAKRQQEPDYEGDRLHSFLVTACDFWDDVCINNMKIVDLGSAEDGIAATVNPQKLVGNQWNWQIRRTRFHQLTAIGRTLMMLGVRVYFETHLKTEIIKNEATGNYRPDWEKHMNGYLNQIIWFNRENVRDKDGRPTGETRFTADFYKCKTNVNLQGQKRVVLTTIEGDAPVWNGLPEISSPVQM